MSYSDLAKRQGLLLRAVNDTAAILLSSDENNFEEALDKGMGMLAECMNVDRINIWKNEIKDGVLRYAYQYGWVKPEYTSKAVKGNASFAYLESIPQWGATFSKGECINGALSDLSYAEQNRLEPYGIKSILIIPVHIHEKFWGFVSFDDCHQSRTFSDEDVSILRSGSLMLASAINRSEISTKMRQTDEITKIMLDATPLCCNLWNQKFENIECNEEAVKLFELKDKKEYLDRFFQLSPHLQPDGRLTSEKALEYITKAFKEGRAVFEWMHQKLDGTPVPAEITLVRVKHGDEYIVNGYTRDLREYKKMMSEIEYKDTLLHTVNDVAAILLESETDEFEKDLWHCMSKMAAAVGVDRVYIWKNHVKDGELYCTQLYEWSEGAAPQQGNELTIDIPYTDTVPGWEETLSAGKCINGLVSEMSDEAKAQLAPQGIKSILVVPVFLKNKFWGFVGFDDCKNERIFSVNEESILRSGSLLFANSLLRNEMVLEQRAASSKMEAVLKNYTGIIFSVNRDYIITLFNGLYLKNIGVTSDFLEGKNLNMIKGRRHMDILDKVGETFSNGAQEWISEIDGRQFRAHTTPIYEENGYMSGLVGSLDDITDTIRLQKELEKALKEARNASRAKSDFLSNMSHEMRTPMNAIIGMTAIAKSSNDAQKKDYCLNKIEDASTHLLGVINDILDMSKIEANKFTLSVEEFSFEKTLQKAVNIINFRLDEKHQDFVVHIDSRIPYTLLGDDQRLLQVMTNLLSNAVKFTPEYGSIRLNADLIGQEGDVSEIKISVSDTGIGISKEQQAKLFTSFQQAETSTSRRFGGTGLGLAISKRIVEMMDGDISIDSEVGKGSTFSFNVKLHKGSAKGIKRLSDLSLKDARVLVVDDSGEILEYFKEILDGLDVRCDTALSGEEAHKMIVEGGPYNIYFVDWKMPGMNGIELTRLIKDHDADKSVVIMISSTEWTVIEDDAKSAGVDKFLPKPLFPTTVVECLDECLGEKIVEKSQPLQPVADSFKGYRMLLAEDMEINREIVMAMLESTGVEIDCAENGKIACKMYQENHQKYDMIFMDIQMPEMDGLEATKIIRAMDLKVAKTVPIVAMTANVFKEDVDKCMAAGMNDHVGKPLDIDEVLKKMRHFLHKRQKR